MPVSDSLYAPLILAIVMAWAAVNKQRDDDARTALEWDAMGLPAALNRRWLRRAHPIAELVLAAGLLVCGGVLGVAVALAATALMLAYTLVIIRALRQGVTSCACFGTSGESALGPRTVLRNLSLLLLAALSIPVLHAHSVLSALWVGGPSGLSTGGWLLGICCAMIVSWLVLAPSPAGSSPAGSTSAPSQPADEPAGGTTDGGAAQEPVEIAEPEEEDDYIRTLTPVTTLYDADMRPLDLLWETKRQAHLLIFLNPGCGACSEVHPRIPEWVEQMPQLMVRAVVGMSPDMLKDRAPDWESWSWYDPDHMAARMLRCTATPSAVLLGTDGMLAGGPVSGARRVIELVEDIREQLSMAMPQDAAQAQHDGDSPAAVGSGAGDSASDDSDTQQDTASQAPADASEEA